MMDVQEKYRKRSDVILQNPNYTFKHLEKDKMFEYAEDFRTVYNKAWATHSNFKGMSETQARSIIRKLKPVMDPQSFGLHTYNEEAVGFL